MYRLSRDILINNIFLHHRMDLLQSYLDFLYTQSDGVHPFGRGFSLRSNMAMLNSAKNRLEGIIPEFAAELPIDPSFILIDGKGREEEEETLVKGDYSVNRQSACGYTIIDNRLRLRRNGVDNGSLGIDMPFDPKGFNYTCCLDEVFYVDGILTHILARYPYWEGQAMIIPDISEGHNQYLSSKDTYILEAIHDLVRSGLIHGAGFNSQGSNASVNHLHLHSSLLPVDLPPPIDSWTHVMHLEDASQLIRAIGSDDGPYNFFMHKEGIFYTRRNKLPTVQGCHIALPSSARTWFHRDATRKLPGI